jgi:hypothetical protein
VERGAVFWRKISRRHPRFYAGNGTHKIRRDQYIDIITKTTKKVQKMLKLKRKNQN